MLVVACDSLSASDSPTPCEHAVERIAGSGFVSCENGLVHRPTPGTCSVYTQSETVLLASKVPEEDECHRDAECTEKRYGACAYGQMQYGAPVTPNHCVYGCTVDADCPRGNVCVCAENGGSCVAATCGRDEDCGVSFCAEYSQSCSHDGGFACQKPEDRCQLDSDCPSIGPGSASCTMGQDGLRSCGFSACGG
jgi:hypothetical protein